MILYVDTSAVVKTLLLEPGSSDVEGWLAEADQVASSVITYAEACAALGRNDRLHGADAVRLEASLAALDAQWREFLVLPVSERAAGQVALQHSLRGMDAVQLSTAMLLRTLARQHAAGAEVAFATFDRRLREAAEREGLATFGGRGS